MDEQAQQAQQAQQSPMATPVAPLGRGPEATVPAWMTQQQKGGAQPSTLGAVTAQSPRPAADNDAFDSDEEVCIMLLRALLLPCCVCSTASTTALYNAQQRLL
jgi:hypothetical protein